MQPNPCQLPCGHADKTGCLFGTGSSCHKYHFCRGERMVAATKHFVATKRLSGQNYVCHQKKKKSRDKIFVTTNISREKHVVVATKVSMSPKNFGRNKIIFVAKNICRNKRFVTKKICLSRQTFCRDKRRVWQLPPVIVFMPWIVFPYALRTTLADHPDTQSIDSTNKSHYSKR